MWIRQSCSYKNIRRPIQIVSSHELHTSEPSCSIKKSYYEILGVSKTATVEEIKSAYVNLSKKFHPDRDPSNKNLHNRFVEINEAYHVLTKTSSRREYDSQLEGKQGDPFTLHRNPYPKDAYGDPFKEFYKAQDEYYKKQQARTTEDPFASWFNDAKRRQNQYNKYGPPPFRPFYSSANKKTELIVFLAIVVIFGFWVPYLRYRLYMQHQRRQNKDRELSNEEDNEENRRRWFSREAWKPPPMDRA